MCLTKVVVDSNAPMKRLFIPIMVVAMVALLSACDSAGNIRDNPRLAEGDQRLSSAFRTVLSRA